MATVLTATYRLALSLTIGLSACSGIELPDRPANDSCGSLDTTENCGACGNQCPAGQLCQEGACACPLGQEQCGNHCVPVDSEESCKATCTSDADCTPTDDANAMCNAYLCNVDSGLCEVKPLDDFVLPTAEQVAGDCKIRQCANGVRVEVSSSDDLPIDGKDCTFDYCNDGLPSNPPRPANTLCSDNNDPQSGLCNGEGQCGQCNTPSDCHWLPEDDACQQRTCIDHQCGQEFTPVDTPIEEQVDGDCKLAVCDGKGAVRQNSHDVDLPVDNNDCTKDICDSGAASNPLVIAGTACTDNNDALATLCDGAGQCVACNTASDCSHLPADDECQQRTCINQQCGQVFTSVNTAVSTQVSGDCQLEVCDGAGATKLIAHDVDLPVDNKTCTEDLCDAGVASNPALAMGAACTDSNDAAATLCDGTGSCVACNVAADCSHLPEDDECQQRSCVNNQCGQIFTNADTALSNQVSGDCRLKVCDGNGGIRQNEDNADLPLDANACTADLCTDGTPSNPPKMTGANCAGGVCNGDAMNPACVECNAPSDCGTDSPEGCLSYACVNNSCGTNNPPAGTVVANPLGDCQRLECDGSGNVESLADPSDLPLDDGNACTAELCTNGSASHPAVAIDTPCGNGNYCDGGGSCVQCNRDSQCGGATDCSIARCSAGQCTLEPKPLGTPAPAAHQTSADCQMMVCDGNGSVMATSVVDDSDLPVDDNECTLEVCSTGNPQHLTLADGTACSLGACVTGACKPSWFVLQEQLMFGNNHDMHFTGPSSAWVVNDYGVIWHTADDGATWTYWEPEVYVAMHAIYFVGSTHGWAVGDNGRIQHSNDEGENWHEQASGSALNLKDVHFVDTKIGWAVGEGGTVINTKDGGNTWVPQTSGTTVNLNAVHFTDATTGWAVGASGTIIHTTNGTTWTVQSSTTDKNLNDLYFADDNTAWAVGSSGTILHSSDGGTTWSAQTSGVTRQLRSVHFADTTTGWTVGGPASGLALRTTDGGATWIQNQNAFGGRLNSVYAVSPTTTWIAGPSGYIRKSTDGGDSWVPQAGMSYTDFRDVHFIDPDIGWTVGDDVAMRTNNGGRSWELQDIDGGGLQGIFFLDANMGWAVGVYGTIRHTSDGGANWTTQTIDGVANNSINQKHLTDVHFVDANTGWAIGGVWGNEHVIISTIDGGTTWTEQPNIEDYRLSAMHFFDANTAWAVGLNGTIIKSTDGGASWASVMNGATTTLNLWNVSFGDASNGVVIGNAGTILVSHDGGSLWSAPLSVASSGTPLYDACLVDAMHGWAVGDDNKILRTSDGGVTWVDQETQGWQNLKALSCIDADTAYAVGEYGLVLKTINGGGS